MHWQWGERWAVRQGVWKLLGQGDELRSLGNLNDPEPEKKNYLQEKPELAARLLALHQAWAKEVEPAPLVQLENAGLAELAQNLDMQSY
jgi:hypothetical protein